MSNAQPQGKARKSRKSRTRKPRPPGRPQHVPTSITQGQVRALVGFGRPQEEIAAFLNIAPKTLRLRYPNELRIGLPSAILNVGVSLYDQAVGRPAQYNAEGRVIRKELPPNVAAAIFFLKARAGWRETIDHDNAKDDDGEPKPFLFSRRDEKL